FCGEQVVGSGTVCGKGLADLPYDKTRFWQIGAYVEHVPTGLFLYGAGGKIEGDSPGGVALALVTTGSNDHDFWYVKAGLREKWTHLGHTVLYGEYERFNDGEAFTSTGAARIVDSRVNIWGLGAVQEIDAAAMSLWLSYRHLDGEDTTVTGVHTDFHD